MAGVGEVLEQINIHVEADDKGFVFGPEYLIEEGAANLFVHSQHALLTAAGVDQNAESERQVRFRGEVLDGLRLSVFEDIEIALRQAGNQGTAFVLHVEKSLDDIH